MIVGTNCQAQVEGRQILCNANVDLVLQPMEEAKKVDALEYVVWLEKTQK